MAFWMVAPHSGHAAEASGTADVIECLLISVQPLASLSGSVSWQIRPDLFAGPPNTLYPSLDSPVFRELEFGLDDLDSDQDGTSNLKDAFPNDPTETRDTDGDLIGNNADPDDDNDLMPDDYELELPHLHSDQLPNHSCPAMDAEHS